jgi:hypothetical protein
MKQRENGKWFSSGQKVFDAQTPLQGRKNKTAATDSCRGGGVIIHQRDYFNPTR